MIVATERPCRHSADEFARIERELAVLRIIATNARHLLFTLTEKTPTAARSTFARRVKAAIMEWDRSRGACRPRAKKQKRSS